jgi:hypothetical protein
LDVAVMLADGGQLKGVALVAAISKVDTCAWAEDCPVDDDQRREIYFQVLQYGYCLVIATTAEFAKGAVPPLMGDIFGADGDRCSRFVGMHWSTQGNL